MLFDLNMSQKDLDLSKIVLDLQKIGAWVPYLQNPVYGPITLVLSSEIKECTHGNLHFEHDELLAFYRRFFPPFFKVSNYELFFANFSKCKKEWVQIANLLKYYTINHTLHQFMYLKHFLSKNCLNNILKNNSTLIIEWKKWEQTDECRIDIRKLVGDRSWRWLATLPKWRFCVSKWVEILYEITFLTARSNS